MAVPPSSFTWKVKLAYELPRALAPGVKTRLPAVSCAAVTSEPALKAAPDRVRVPAAGRLLILTAARAFAAASSGSVKPKSAAVSVRGVSSLIVMVALVPAGASLTEATFTLKVNSVTSVLMSTPPTSV